MSPAAAEPSTTLRVSRWNAVFNASHWIGSPAASSASASSTATAANLSASRCSGSPVSRTAAANARRFAHRSPREMVSASGWKAAMPFFFASGSDAKGVGEPSSTRRTSSGWETSSASSVATRT